MPIPILKSASKGNRLLALAKTPLLVCFVFACAGLLPRAAHAQVSIWLQSPKPGPNPNTVLVYATAYSTSAITGWIIYVDDAIVYRTNNTSDVLSHSVTLSNGRHLLYARAWDQGNFGTSSTLMIQVGPAAAEQFRAAHSPLQRSGACTDAEHHRRLDDCSLCAYGTNNTANYWMAPFQNQPSMSGSSLEMYADGLPWTNVLFIDTMLGIPVPIPIFCGTSGSTTTPLPSRTFWSSEFDLWQVLGGKEFMIGSQCDFGDGYWSTWDSANNRWIPNGSLVRTGRQHLAPRPVVR